MQKTLDFAHHAHESSAMRSQAGAEGSLVTRAPRVTSTPADMSRRL